MLIYCVGKFVEPTVQNRIAGHVDKYKTLKINTAFIKRNIYFKQLPPPGDQQVCGERKFTLNDLFAFLVRSVPHQNTKRN